MIPAAFDYIRADSVEGLLNALTEHGDETWFRNIKLTAK